MHTKFASEIFFVRRTVQNSRKTHVPFVLARRVHKIPRIVYIDLLQTTSTVSRAKTQHSHKNMNHRRRKSHRKQKYPCKQSFSILCKIHRTISRYSLFLCVVVVIRFETYTDCTHLFTNPNFTIAYFAKFNR